MPRPTKEAIKKKIAARKANAEIENAVIENAVIVDDNANPQSVIIKKEKAKETVKENDAINKISDIKAPEYNEFDGNVLHENYDDTTARIIGGKSENIVIPEYLPKRKQINIDKPLETSTESKTENTLGKSESTASQPKTDVHPLEPKTNEKEIFNPALDGASKSEARKAAERFTDKILGVYAMLQTWTYLGLNLEEEKLKQRAMNGKFDMDCLYIQIPISNTETMTAKEWLDSYNRGLRKTLNFDTNTRECTLTQKFIDEVRPPMIRVFTARGIGMTDTQAILWGFGQDIFEKGTHLIGLKLSINALLKGLQKLNQQQKAPTPTRQQSAQQTQTNNNIENNNNPPPPAKSKIKTPEKSEIIEEATIQDNSKKEL